MGPEVFFCRHSTDEKRKTKEDRQNRTETVFYYFYTKNVKSIIKALEKTSWT